MIFRLLGMAVTMALIAYFFYGMNRSRVEVDHVTSSSPALQGETKALQNAGVNASDKKVLEQYAIEKAKEIEAYQNQINQKPE